MQKVQVGKPIGKCLPVSVTLREIFKIFLKVDFLLTDCRKKNDLDVASFNEKMVFVNSFGGILSISYVYIF